MKVKICGIKTSEDIDTVLKAGVDAIGFLVGQVHKSPDFILPSTAGRLAAALPPFVTPVLVTHLNSVEEIIDIVAKSSISTIQLHGNLAPEQVKEISDKLPPGGKIILATYINKSNTPDILEYYPFISAVLLDAFNESRDRIETGSPVEYCWEAAAEFIKTCSVPVILSGGLNPANLTEALTTCRPYAVDVNRGVKENHGGKCCLFHCRSFVRTARLASQEQE
jgi:phosphoribosylanthranilate isomerase